MAVRRERVILELEDQFSGPLARPIATTKVFEKTLDDLDGTTIRASRSQTSLGESTEGYGLEAAIAQEKAARLRKELRDQAKTAVDLEQGIDGAADSTVRLGRSSDSTARSIDRLSGRLGLAVDTALTLGPALLPLGAVGAAGMASLASSAGFAAVAAGTMAVAFGGVGDALEAVNKAHLEPTKENIQEAEKAMKRLAPEARAFVEQLDSMRGLGGQLRDAGAGALFPGLVEALETLESRGPEAKRILVAINETVGQIAADGAASLASERWDDFFQMLETEGPSILDSTADAIGNVTHGLAEMWEAFAPLNRDGMGWIVEATENFDEWAEGLEDSKGFRSFTRYIRENGPQVEKTLGAVADAAVAIVDAAAPLGGPALKAIESFADIVAKVAGSSLGTPLLAAVTAMRLINRLAPRTAAALATLNAPAVVGAGGKGSKGGPTPVVVPGGKPAAAPRAPRVPRGPSATTGLAAMLGLDILTDELGWKEATETQQKNAKTFFEEYGATVAEQAEKARVKLSDALGVDTGSGPFGLMENDQGLSEAISLEPIEKQIELQQHLRRQYGLTYKDLERQGVLVRGFTKDFRDQRKAVDPLARDIERLGKMKAKPEVDLDDKGAKRKEREQEDWINRWGRKNAQAEARLDARQARKEQDAIDQALNGWDRSSATAMAGVNTAEAQRKLEQVAATLRNLDGSRAYTEVITEYKVVRSSSDAIAPRGRSADGGTVPRTGKPYADRHPYLLADGEEVISNRFGQADRNRELLKAINANRYANGGTVGRAPAPNITVGGPSVNVGGPAVRVFIDGNEVRAIVRSEQAKADDFDRWMSRG